MKQGEKPTAMQRYEQQCAEWQAIRNEWSAMGPNVGFSAFQVTLEQRKRLLARGERFVTLEELEAEHQAEVPVPEQRRHAEIALTDNIDELFVVDPQLQGGWMCDARLTPLVEAATAELKQELESRELAVAQALGCAVPVEEGKTMVLKWEHLVPMIADKSKLDAAVRALEGWAREHDQDQRLLREARQRIDELEHQLSEWFDIDLYYELHMRHSKGMPNPWPKKVLLDQLQRLAMERAAVTGYDAELSAKAQRVVDEIKERAREDLEKNPPKGLRP